MSGTRHRTKSLPPVYKTYTRYKNGAVYRTKSQLIDIDDWDMIDTVVPDYFKRLERGEILNNAFTLTRSQQYSSGNHYYYQKQIASPHTLYTGGVEGSLTMYYLTGPIDVNPFTDVSATMLKHAKQTCLAKVDAPEYAFAEDIGEFTETLRFMRDPLRSLRTLAGTFESRWQKKFLSKRRRFPAGSLNSLRLKAMSEAWLELRYGVMPLMYTASNIIESLNDNVFDNALPDKKYFSKKVYMKSVDPYDYSEGDNHYLRSQSIKIEAKATIRYRVTHPKSLLASRYGVRAKDIPRVIWDLKPLSFMVDRALNIGQTISGLLNLADPTVSFVAASTTTKITRFSNVRLVRRSYPAWDPLISNGDTLTRENFSYNRIPWNPTANDTLPVFLPKQLISDVKSQSDLFALIALTFLGRTSKNQHATMYGIEI